MVSERLRVVRTLGGRIRPKGARRARAALCRTRIALASLAAAVLAVLAATTLAPGGALANPAGTTHYPDLQTVIPTDFSVVQGTDGREFRYTHLVYNAGPGPLEIQPQYSETSGNYLGQQLLFTHNASNAYRTPISTTRLYEGGLGVKWVLPLVPLGTAGGVVGASGAQVSIAPWLWGFGEMGGVLRRRSSIESRQAARR
jgi:hypothetical protein